MMARIASTVSLVALRICSTWPPIAAASKPVYAFLLASNAGALVAIYVAVLLVSRELGRSDLDNVRAVFARRAGR